MSFSATWMDLVIIVLSEVTQRKTSKSDRGSQVPYDITYMWNLKYDTNELIYKTEIDSQT